MDDTVTNVNLIFRWIHVVAGIAWIGHLYFFNWVNAHFAKTLTPENKRAVVPELLPRALYWFRWGAAWTWITGLVLLGLIYRAVLVALTPLLVVFFAYTAATAFVYLYAKSGATAADEKSRVQRFWRDANTAALHSSIDWDTLSALYGTQQLGLQPQGIF